MDIISTINIIKDIFTILTPIIIPLINYLSNKKTKKDIQLDNKQILLKISAELESQKQLISWKNSLPTTDKYIEKVGLIRHGNVANLKQTTDYVFKYIQKNDLSYQELIEIKNILLKINTPINSPQLYPYEIPILIDFSKLLHQIDEKINGIATNNK